MGSRIPLYKKVWRIFLKGFYSVERSILKNKKKLNIYKWIVTKLPIKNNKVLVSNYFGHGYGDNPKCIVDELIHQGKDIKIIWLINDGTFDFPKEVTPVNKYSLRAYYESATAKAWVSNIRIGHLTEKRKKQIYLQTNHGFLSVKKVEAEAEEKLNTRYLSQAKKDGAWTDGIIVESGWREQLMRKAFWLKEDCDYLRIGSPKVDEFLSLLKPDNIKRIKEEMGLPSDAYIVLYAPTFRNKTSNRGYITDFNAVINAFFTRHKKVIMLLRFHPNTINDKDSLFETISEGFLDVTKYPDVQEILAVADCIISDYSSMPFVFSMSNKPVFIYASDFKDYCSERGVNDLFWIQPFPVCYNIEELINAIKKYNEEEWKEKRREFYINYPMYNNGEAATNAVKWLYKKGLK